MTSEDPARTGPSQESRRGRSGQEETSRRDHRCPAASHARKAWPDAPRTPQGRRTVVMRRTKADKCLTVGVDAVKHVPGAACFVALEERLFFMGWEWVQRDSTHLRKREPLRALGPCRERSGHTRPGRGLAEPRDPAPGDHTPGDRAPGDPAPARAFHAAGRRGRGVGRRGHRGRP